MSTETRSKMQKISMIVGIVLALLAIVYAALQAHLIVVEREVEGALSEQETTFDLITKYWVDSSPNLLVRGDMLMHEDDAYQKVYLTGAEVCFSWPDTYDRFKDNIQAARDSGSKILVSHYYTDFDQGVERTKPGCFVLYLATSSDFEGFESALEEIKCSRNHTDYKIGDTVYSDPTLIDQWYKRYEARGEIIAMRWVATNKKPSEEFLKDISTDPSEYIDDSAEILEICEDVITVRFPNGIVRTSPEHWFVEEIN